MYDPSMEQYETPVNPPRARLKFYGLLTGVVLISLMAMLAVAKVFVAPGMCEDSLNNEIDAILASSAPMENWKPSKSMWSCRVLSENERREIGARVMVLRGPEIMSKAFDQAFRN